MILIAGLGNPEKNYKGTRHNVGFEVINKLAHDNNLPINKAKFRAHIGEGIIGGKKVILAKPQTYMNLSGESIIEIMKFYKLKQEDVIIVYDDISLDIGNIRIRQTGSAGGHNGVKNILQHFQSDAFTRVKVGVGKKPPNYNLADYVLSKFSKSEEGEIALGIATASESIECILKESVQFAMNKYNKKQGSEVIE